MPPKKKIQRLRTGCWTCRKRGYKCDEAKPACRNCTRMKLDCEGYGIRLKWPGERRQRSPKNNNSPSCSSPSEHTFYSPPALSPESAPIQVVRLPKDQECAELVPGVASSYQHIFKIQSEGDDESDLFNDGFTLSTPSPNTWGSYESASPPASPPSTSVSALLNHFSTVVAEDLSPMDAFSVNIYREIMIPFSSKSVQHAMCGLAAAHMAVSMPEYAPLAAEYKLEAIRSLYEKLQVDSYDHDALSTSLLLATQEALEGNFVSWKSHVTGAVRGVIDGPLTSSTEPGVRAMVDLLQYHDIMSSMFSTEGPLLANQYMDCLLFQGMDEMSLGRTAISLFRIAGAISALAARGDVNDDTLMAQQLDIQLILGVWSISPNNLTPEMYDAAHIIKYAVQIYYYLKLSPKTTDNEQLTAAISQALYHLGRIPTSSGVNSILTWPLFQIATASKDASLRQLMINRLEQIPFTIHRSHIRQVIDAIKNSEVEPQAVFF